MKDKNGVEIRVGDRIRRLSDGEEATVEAALSEQPGDCIAPSRSGKPQCRDVTGTSEQTHRWEILGDCAALFSAIENGLRHLHELLPRLPNELYAEFRRVVEETVRREAPKVRVVTDFKGHRGIAELRFLGQVERFAVSMSESNAGYRSGVMDALKEFRHSNDPLR